MELASRGDGGVLAKAVHSCRRRGVHNSSRPWRSRSRLPVDQSATQLPEYDAQ